MSTTNLIRLLASCALTVFLFAGSAHTSQEAADRPAASLKDIKVSFKVDPRVSRGMYMGDSWITPPTYLRVGEGKETTVEARAEGIDAGGKSVSITPEWVPADPEMVAVSPVRGQQVNITVRRPGQSSLKVVSPGFAREMLIKATYEGTSLKVEISGAQTPAAEKQGLNQDTRSRKEKLSYSLGYKTARNMKSNSMDVDPDIFVRAFREALAGAQASMTEQEMDGIIQGLQKDMTGKNKSLAKKQKDGGEAFLIENAKQEGVVTLPSGLQYKVIAEGTGRQPAKTDKVKVNYRGTLINGTEFDSSHKRGEPAVFNVNKVIRGWSEGLQLMKEGARWTLYVPSYLAYGSRGAGRGMIGPNQTLIFEVELVSVE